MEDGNGRAIDFKNTLIILTSNVGTDVIMKMAEQGATEPDPEMLNALLKPDLLRVFPPALLGRLVTIPYFPLSASMLAGIVHLQLGRIKKRIADNHDAKFDYSGAVVDHIVTQCADPDSRRPHDRQHHHQHALPDLARRILNRALEKTEITSAKVDVEEGRFVYDVA